MYVREAVPVNLFGVGSGVISKMAVGVWDDFVTGWTVTRGGGLEVGLQAAKAIRSRII